MFPERRKSFVVRTTLPLVSPCMSSPTRTFGRSKSIIPPYRTCFFLPRDLLTSTLGSRDSVNHLWETLEKKNSILCMFLIHRHLLHFTAKRNLFLRFSSRKQFVSLVNAHIGLTIGLIKLDLRSSR